MNLAVLSLIGQRWRELVGFALLFRFVESLLFAPMAATAGQWLLGRTVLDSTALVSFLFSPRGFLALALAAITALSIRLIEHAGLSAIISNAIDGQRLSSRETLRLVWRQLPVLVRVAARFVGIGLVTVLPLAAVTGGFAAWLLPRHDVNYYLKLRPPEFIAAAAIIVGVALATAVVMLMLVARWRWVVQGVLFEQMEAREAFHRSAILTQGHRMRLAGVVIGVGLVSMVLGLIASALGSACAWIVLGVTGHGIAILALSFGALLLLRTIISTACTFFGSFLDAGVFTSLYRRRLAAVGGQARMVQAGQITQAELPRWLPTALVASLLVFAATGTWFALETIPDERPITLHAHRGYSIRAPENTLAAVREAIAARTDYIETDVQLTKDDVLVVAHDSDFSRLGGVARKVWDLTYDEIRAIPIGRSAEPEYRQEYAPTFQALLTETQGRAKVNIELKYYGDHQPDLARKVIDAVREMGMLDQVVIQCLEYEPLLEVQRLAPQVPTGYLLSFNAREPARLNVSFLSVEQNRLDRRFIQKAHRRGRQVLAWTVNTADDMERLFDLGIDGIITDQSALARKTLEDYLSRPAAERVIRRIRAWLAE